jgi:hypothetical protein
MYVRQTMWRRLNYRFLQWKRLLCCFFCSGAESLPIPHHHHKSAIRCWWSVCVAHVGNRSP